MSPSSTPPTPRSTVTPFRAALPWLAAGLLVLAVGGILAASLRPEAFLFAAIPAVALFIVGGLVWSRGPA